MTGPHPLPVPLPGKGRTEKTFQGWDIIPDSYGRPPAEELDINAG